MISVAVVNQKGGVAKTTTSANLAVGLAVSGYRVLAIDLDPQAHLTLSLKVDSTKVGTEETVAPLFSSRRPDVRTLIVATAVDNVRLIPSTIRLATVEKRFSDTPRWESRVLKALEQVHDDFDWVIMDCPPDLHPLCERDCCCG